MKFRYLNIISWSRILILGNIIFLGCHKKPGSVLTADYLIKNCLTTNNDSARISRQLRDLLSNTVWKNKIQVNRVYEPGKVNIYIIDGSRSYIQEDDLIAKLVNNCAYAGSNIIFFDDTYLQSFLNLHQVIPDQPSEGLKDDQECFLYWVIGHELGHFVCGHPSGDFDPGSLDHFVKSSSLDNQQELAADSFFVSSMMPDKRLLISEERLMMNILNAEIKRKIGPVQTQGVGIIYDYTNEHFVSYALQPTHPEYVIRLSRMLELSSRMAKDTGLNNLVGGFIRQLREVK